MDFTPSAADAQGINRVFPVLAEEDFAVHNKYFGSAKYVGKPIMDEILGLNRNTQGVFPENQFINGGAVHFQAGAVGAPVAMTNAVYNGPDSVYSLIQGANPTIQQIAAPAGFQSTYAIDLVSGGTTNRFGNVSALEYLQTHALRGRQVTFSITARARKNAGSGNINIRMAIIEWIGTANSITRDVVNSWTNATYTSGNFFKAANQNILAVSPQIALAHNTTTQCTLTGTVGASANNLILIVWAQDVPAHAADAISISELGLYRGTYAPAVWAPRLPEVELALCQRQFYVPGYLSDGSFVAGANTPQVAAGLINNATSAIYQIQLPVQMLKLPVCSPNVAHWICVDGITNATPSVMAYSNFNGTQIRVTCTIAGAGAGRGSVLLGDATGGRRMEFDARL